MPTNSQHLRRIPKAPLAHIQPVDLLLPAQHFIGVEGGVPGLDVQVAEHNVGDVGREMRAVRWALGGGGEDGVSREEGSRHYSGVAPGMV